MNNKKLTSANVLFISSMLFGLFFGAGNLIFPVFLGQEAGSLFFPATGGFILAAAGLPFLAILAYGISKKDSLHELSATIGPTFAIVFTTALYLTIGPLFALPRTGTVAFEVGLSNILPESSEKLALFIFTFIFFGIALFFALRSSELVTWVGKILNPLFLGFLCLLIIFAIFQPLSSGFIPSENPDYLRNPLLNGFTEGYQTMDALAALAFGSIVIENIKRLGVTNRVGISVNLFKAGSISLLGMLLIYASLAWLGGTGAQTLPHAQNGGIGLANICYYYFGNFGSIFLTLIVTIACLKTAIGLIVASSETFEEMFSFNITFRQYAIGITLVTFGVSNAGLDLLIQYAVPVLSLIYPVAMLLILFGLLTPIITNTRFKQLTIGVALFFSIGDVLTALPEYLQQSQVIAQIIQFHEQYVPLFQYGMAWLVPAILCFCGYALYLGVMKIKQA